MLRHLQSSLQAEYGSPEYDTQTGTAIQDTTPSLQTQQDGAARDFLGTRGMVMSPLKIHTTNHMQVDDGEQQKSDSHVPFLSSSLPILKASLGTGLQVDILSSLSKSPPSPSWPGSNQPGGDPQRGQDNENGICDSIFRQVEDYIIKCFRTCGTLNLSFLSSRPSGPQRSVSEGAKAALYETSRSPDLRHPHEDIPELDAKTLLLGDVAENGGLCHRYFT